VSTQNLDSPCWIITAVTSLSASAAADLLTLGDYAVALPFSTIHYHGVRTSTDSELTVESASGLIQSLKRSNDRYATNLARRSNHRFFLRYVILRGEFEAVRRRQGDPDLSDVECLTALLLEKVSESGAKVIEAAREKNERYAKLSTAVFSARGVERILAAPVRARFAQLEAAMLHSLIQFELKANDSQSWAFSSSGLAQLADDFLLLTETINHHGEDRMKALCKRWGKFILSEDEVAEIEAAPTEAQDELRLEKLRHIFQPLWLFFVAICQSLQSGENTLTAVDAYWLGLIDEVLGNGELAALRLIAEYTPDEPIDDGGVAPAIAGT
jgi:hypothetical protein